MGDQKNLNISLDDKTVFELLHRAQQQYDAFLGVQPEFGFDFNLEEEIIDYKYSWDHSILATIDRK